MKKSVRMGVKPLALATAFAAGTSASMIAFALPGGDTLGAAGTVAESICQRSVDMTIAGAARSITTGTGACQDRTLPPTKGFVLTETAPAGDTVSDSSAMVNAGGELYEAYVGGNRDAAVLLTPNRSLAVSRTLSFLSGNDGAMTFDLHAAVQPSTGLQNSWMTGAYTITNRTHNFGAVVSGQQSVYANPNDALGERNFTSQLQVQFNGDGTCTVTNYAPNTAATVHKDASQDSGDNYVFMSALNRGLSAAPGGMSPYADWLDQSGDVDTLGTRQRSCTYSTSAGEVAVTYTLETGDLTLPQGDPGLDATSWTADYNVSADLRYLVSTGTGAVDMFVDQVAGTGAMAVGVRTGAAVFTGKTYLFNALDGNYASSTPGTAAYENPLAPLYQEEECVNRGSLSFSGGGACTVNMASTCTGRFKSGLEEASSGAANGSVADTISAFDGFVSPACSWTGTAQNLTVNLTVLRQDGNSVVMKYDGSVSDNGEAIVLQGVNTQAAAVPDVDSPTAEPLQAFNLESFLVAQEYQGTLTADADSDGLNNLGEFQWALDLTPPSKSRSDMDNDWDSDVLTYNTLTSEYRVFSFESGAVASNNTITLMTPTEWVYVGMLDADYDGDKDVLVRSNITNVWRLVTVENGADVTTTKLKMWEDPALEFLAAADFDGDGDEDILLRNTATNAYRVFEMQGGQVVGNNNLALYSSTAWQFITTIDIDGDSNADVLMRNSNNGNWRLFTVDNKVVTGNYYPNLVPSNLDYQFAVVADLNGDGNQDLVLRSATTQTSYRSYISDGTIFATKDEAFALWAATNYPTVVETAGDYDGDGDDDILMRRNEAGMPSWRLFTVQGGSVISSAPVPGLWRGLEYKVLK